MTGPEHYCIAQDLVLAQTVSRPSGVRVLREHVDPQVIAIAQVHAILALAAATAMGYSHEMPAADEDAWLITVQSKDSGAS